MFLEVSQYGNWPYSLRFVHDRWNSYIEDYRDGIISAEIFESRLWLMQSIFRRIGEHLMENPIPTPNIHNFWIFYREAVGAYIRFVEEGNTGDMIEVEEWEEWLQQLSEHEAAYYASSSGNETYADFVCPEFGYGGFKNYLDRTGNGTTTPTFDDYRNYQEIEVFKRAHTKRYEELRISLEPHSPRAVVFLSEDIVATTAGDRVALIDVRTGEVLSELQDSKRLKDLAINRDQSLIVATGYGSSTLNMWSFDGRMMREFDAGHQYPLEHIALGGDGGLLAAVGDPTEPLVVWETGTGSLVLEVTNLPGVTGLDGIAFHPDNNQVAVINDAGASSILKGDRRLVVSIWDVRSGRTLKSFEIESEGLVWGFKYAPDGETLGIAYQSGVIQFWDVDTASLWRRMAGGERSMEWSEDSGTLISSGRQTVVWDWETGEVERQLFERFDTVALSPSGESLVWGDSRGVAVFTTDCSECDQAFADFAPYRDYVAQVLEFESAFDDIELITSVRFAPPLAGTSDLSFLSQGNELAFTRSPFGFSPGRIELWTTEGGYVDEIDVDSFQTEYSGATGRIFAVGRSGVTLLDAGDHSEIREIGFRGVREIQVSTDGRTLAVLTSHLGEVARETVIEYPNPDLPFFRVSETYFTPIRAPYDNPEFDPERHVYVAERFEALNPGYRDKEQLETDYDGSLIEARDASTGNLRYQVFIDRDVDFSHIAISPDNALLSACSNDGIYSWELETGRRVRTVDVPDGIYCRALTYSPDSQRLFFLSGNSIQVVSVSTGSVSEIPYMLGEDYAFISALESSADGRFLLAVEGGKMSAVQARTNSLLKIIDSVTGAVIRTFGSGGDIWGVAKHPVRNVIAVGYRGGSQDETRLLDLDLLDPNL